MVKFNDVSAHFPAGLHLHHIHSPQGELTATGEIGMVPDAQLFPALSHKPSELEIARIRIRSTTSDVVCVYARPIGQRIAYRVVDEYEGDTLSERRTRTSVRPLTLGQLVDFFLGGWDLCCCLEANFEDDLEGMLQFFNAESEFYPCLEDELVRRVRLHFAHLDTIEPTDD